jgi:hypothetical protein
MKRKSQAATIDNSTEIADYSKTQSGEQKAICDCLDKEIRAALPQAVLRVCALRRNDRAPQAERPPIPKPEPYTPD